MSLETAFTKHRRDVSQSVQQKGNETVRRTTLTAHLHPSVVHLASNKTDANKSMDINETRLGVTCLDVICRVNDQSTAILPRTITYTGAQQQ